ncbi:YunC family protein [Bacillus sp. FJAT-27245]|uniref:YunC family protein n=1 Tax=Bacillus sp. FJAT-27245 TaxID=1684144 RepID=UPI0006A7A344|nr:DUF1805 domain-containing protein [Bacillus sp. FJAT-27245]
MIDVTPLEVGGNTFLGITVKLPRTTLLIITGGSGYIMCGALDIGLLNRKLRDRKIVAGRAVGVKTIDELLDAPLESVTQEAEKRGIHAGMTGRNALPRMI